MTPLPDPINPSRLLLPPAALRARLAGALRDVDILRGLLRLAESVARRDGTAPSSGTPTLDDRQEPAGA